MKTDELDHEFITSYKKGIDLQREIYKNARLENEIDTMALCIQNIKSEVKSKAISKGELYKKKIKDIEIIINWFYNIDKKFYKNTPRGVRYQPPMNIVTMKARNLSKAYEIIISILECLDLL